MLNFGAKFKEWKSPSGPAWGTMISPFSSASWIASPICGSSRACAPVPYFRKTFALGQPVQSAWLNVTALGLYECEINGHRIGDELFAPGWTEYHKRVQYQTYNVTEFLRHGENTLGAILGDGWYTGVIAWCGRQVYGDRPRFMAQLEMVLQDGSTFIVASDTSWRTSVGPIVESDMLLGEDYDARLELTGWSQPGFNDANWQSAIPGTPEHPVEVVPRIGPPVRKTGEIRPVSERKVKHNLVIYDLGQNFTGRVKIRVKFNRGSTIRLRFAEILNPDGSLYTENLRAARCTDYYTCKGGGEIETWEPRFTFHGFRYVEVEVVGKILQAFGNTWKGIGPDNHLEVIGQVLHSDTPPTGTFRCSHEGLNQLQHNIVWGQKSNFFEVPTDCPQRDERLGWTGDAQVFIRTAAFNMDVREFFHKWLRDMRDSQTEHGGIPCVIPSPWHGDQVTTDGGPAWADAAVICPWTIYLCYGDRKILEDNYAMMEKFMTFMGEKRCKGFIRSHPDAVEWGGFGDWLALDGGGKTEGITPFDLIGTAFYAYDANLMAQIATILGRYDDAKKYRVLHEKIAEAFRQRYITPDGLVASGTQTAYVLALHFGLVDQSLRSAVAHQLARDIEKRGNHLATGFVGTPYILDVLESEGHLDVAYKLLEQETFPSWLFPVRNGATTIWERWDGWTPDKGVQDKGMNSFNHYAYGAVGAWMYRTVAGLELDPAEPGYKHVIFRPRPGGSISWAEASLKTAQGTVAIRWELKGSELHLKLTVPPDSHATVSLPEGFSGNVPVKVGAGEHSFIAQK